LVVSLKRFTGEFGGGGILHVDPAVCLAEIAFGTQPAASANKEQAPR
jgi:hypothetical protein